MRTLEPILAAHPFFKGLEPRYMELLVSCAANVRFDAGQYLFREGEDARHFYLVRHGKVALEVTPPGKPPLIIDTIQEGQVFGWSWLVPPYKYRFDAQALTLVRAISLEARCLRGKFDQDHKLGFEIFKRFFPVVISSLQHVRIQLMDIYGTRI